MNLIPRPTYLNFLKTWKDKSVIKVVSGVRRCGKSTLFILFQNYLRKNGIKSENIIQMNFEQPEFMNITDSTEVYNYLKPKLTVSGMKYIFLDEIQHITHFEKIADALNTLADVDLYITGSNGYFMSGELATLLTGRFVELKMLPLSFKEYVTGYQEFYPNSNLSTAKMFNNYLRFGSFPFILQLNNEPLQIEQYLDGIFTSVVYRDVQTRLKVSDHLALEKIIRFLFDNVGNILSMRKIANTISNDGFKISPATVERYISALVDSLLIYRVPRFDIHGRDQLRTNEKYYIVDPGLRYHLIAGTKMDRGHVLENIIYLELLRRGEQVNVGALPKGEVDFVTKKGQEVCYYQVSESVIDPKTLTRELKPLQGIDDHYPKYLLTLDEIGAGENYQGIKQLNILDWLLS
ncbi:MULTISPECIES: ATP-binding protein [Lactobacillus]|uniref:ATP-binding protein n=1 Tax=Lactobacillus xujianguonis TaxID=2495899 RepID=A0A437SU91_9LACO|nr:MULTISPECIES: ATP-binding protein [Lactobacillus]RVU70387.1 ATP-binding protein [Lactobacillus xujianguonis]RVU73634.1 ATP-binding protein [Lactobacillus xujianguonis]